MTDRVEVVAKLRTGIGGFDEMALGGLPMGRPTIVSGTTGSGKTLFAVQFLAEGVRQFDEPGVLVTFEEPPSAIRRNVASLGFDIAGWEAMGKWAFVDASLGASEEQVVVGAYDFGALVSRIEHAVDRIGAKRLSIDTLEAIFGRFADSSSVRTQLFEVAAAVNNMGVTSVITAERAHDHDGISRFGVEEFVADNVVILRNVLEQEKRRRTAEILKFRGAAHRSGEFSFAIDPEAGITVIPFSLVELQQVASSIRVSAGNAELDRMCGGGLYRDSVSFVSGPTGTGKTLLANHFAAAGVTAGERCVLFSFEESRDQLFRNASSWGFDLDAMERSGRLQIVCDYPEVASLDDHFILIRQRIDEFRPNRLAVDNLSALERISTPRGLRDFVVGLAAYLRREEITCLFTSATATLYGGGSATEANISSLADTILLLRYVEVAGDVRRAIAVLKARGSAHDHRILEFRIDDHGMHIGQPFRHLAGILSGTPTLLSAADLAQVTRTLVLEDEEAR
jgi:circadian clock protein KaiC